MTSRKNSKHRGEILRDAVNERGMNITKLMKKVNYSRSTYYNHILDPDLPYEVLEKYGKAMSHDFSDEFPNFSGFRLEDEPAEYGRPETLEKALEQMDMYRDKYQDILEKYQKLLEEKINQ